MIQSLSGNLVITERLKSLSDVLTTACGSYSIYNNHDKVKYALGSFNTYYALSIVTSRLLSLSYQKETTDLLTYTVL